MVIAYFSRDWLQKLRLSVKNLRGVLVQVEVEWAHVILVKTQGTHLEHARCGHGDPLVVDLRPHLRAGVVE